MRQVQGRSVKPVLYNDQGRYAESESLFLEALAGENEVVGDEHPITIASMNNLADLYMQQGRYAEARPWLERAVTTAERVLGPTHADYGLYLHTLGELCLATGDLENAEGHLGQAREIYELRSGHIYLGLLLSELASVAALRDDRASALDLLNQALERGWTDGSIRDNPHLESLHGDPDFAAIVEEIEKRILHRSVR